MIKQRKRILFISEAVTLAHVVRPIVLAKTLDPAHYEITFACDPRYNRIVGKLPFAYEPIESITSEQFLSCVVKGRTGYDLATLRAYVEDDFRVLRKVAPDLVVGDFRLSLAVSARLAGKPYMGICNAYWSPYAQHRSFPVPEHPLTRLFGVRLTEHLFNLARPLIFANLAFPWNRLLREYSLPTIGLDLRQVFSQGDHTLYADLPQLIPTYRLPASHHYIGPILWSPPVPTPDWWQDIPDDKPIIYVTLGSSGDTGLLPEVFAALKELPVTGLVATVGGSDLAEIPDNIFAAEYLPGEVAANRASLVICNGGSPTTQQALAAGVPVLGIASNLDQYLNMAYMQRAGVGLLVRAGKTTRSLLYRLVSDMLNDPSWHNSAKLYQRYMASYSPRDIFPRLVESVLGCNLHPSPKS